MVSKRSYVGIAENGKARISITKNPEPKTD
jgi:hypothetical protein